MPYLNLGYYIIKENYVYHQILMRKANVKVYLHFKKFISL